MNSFQVEEFSSLLNITENNGDLERVKVCQDALSFNHLLFADDSVILMEVNEESLNHLHYILSLYAVCLGRAVNVDNPLLCLVRIPSSMKSSCDATVGATK